MDYPKSVPAVGLVNGRFVDENPATGMPGSLIPASWGNAVTEEVLGVIKAAGLKPSESKNNQLLESLTTLGLGQLLPVSALPRATVDTADGRVVVSSTAVTGNGGKVSLSAGNSIVLSERAGSGASGWVKSFTTTAWNSAPMSTNSTYFLRGKVVAGELSLYLQQGSLRDGTPALMVGDSAALSGGGFPSTALDVCLAWIRTSAAGTVPTVVTLYNRPSLQWTQHLNGTGVVYLPIDPHARGGRLILANPRPHPTAITSIVFAPAGWLGGNYAYLNASKLHYVAVRDGWKAIAPCVLFTSNAVNDVTITTAHASFEHEAGRSLWQSYQAQHTDGALDATADELLFSMGIKEHSSTEYTTGVAINFSNAANVHMTWELIR